MLVNGKTEKEMDMVNNIGQMVLFMRDSGKITWLMDMVV